MVESDIQDEKQTYLEVLDDEIGEPTMIGKVLLRIPLIGPWLGYMVYQHETEKHLKIWERRLRDLARRGRRKGKAQEVLDEWRSL